MFSFRAVTQLQREQNKKSCDCYNNQKSDQGIMLGFHYQP